MFTGIKILNGNLKPKWKLELSYVSQSSRDFTNKQKNIKITPKNN
jgi:hypothetical protein